MTPKGTHIQHPECSQQSTNNVTVQKWIIESDTPLLTRSQMAKILGYKTAISVDRATARKQLKKVVIGGAVRYDMYDNGVSEYVKIKD